MDDQTTPRTTRVYAQDIVPFIPLVKPTLQASTEIIATPSFNSMIVLDLNAANIHTVTLTGNAVFTLKNASIGQEFKVRLVQDSVGSRVVTWFPTIAWAGGVAPTLTVTANHWDILEFICTASGLFDGKVYGANFS